MHKLGKTLLATLALMTLSACNAKDPSQPKPPTPQANGVIPQAQLDALNKAKNVEHVLQQEAQQRDAQGDQ